MSESDKIDFLRFLGDYLTDAREGFQSVNNALLILEKDFSRTDLLDEVFRVFHTMKSSSIMLEFTDIAELAHIAEDLLDLMRKNEVQVTQEGIDVLFEVADTLGMMVKERSEKKGASGADWSARILGFRNRIAGLKDNNTSAPTQPGNTEGPEGDRKGEGQKTNAPAIEKVQTVRVHVDLLDSLFNIVGEIIILRNRIETIVSDMPDKELKSTLSEMNRLISELQDNVSVARMVPVAEVFEKFPRMVRDLAKERHKEIDFILEGSEIELDKAIIDAIGEPVIHLLRNSIDHGIEPPDERKRLNKHIQGKVRLVAKRTETHILIEVEDDGRGIDAARIRRVAVKKGLIQQEEAETLQDNILSLLFHPSFSTAEEVTGLSGRGVGLYIVKSSARELGGTVEMTTQIGQGTRFTMKLPLSTAIMQMLMISVGGQVFGVPSDMVVETLDVKQEDIRKIYNNKALVLRNEVIPFVLLHEAMGISVPHDQENFVAIIVSRGSKFLAVGVDAVLDQMENIVKPFDPIAQQCKGFSGGMILGDGRVALLLDIPALLNFEVLKER